MQAVIILSRNLAVIEKMPLSLDDIMEFMKNDKEEKARERERDKKELKELISLGVKDEVATALKPIQERQRHLEGVQSDMLQEFKDMIEEVREMKNSIQSNRAGQFPSLPRQSVQTALDPLLQWPNNQQSTNDGTVTGAIE